MNWNSVKLALGGLALCATLAPTASAAVTLTGAPYSQNFDSLASANTGNAWANNSTLPGWYLFNVTGAALPTYNAGTGSSNTGAYYSFGSEGSGERSLGGVASGGSYWGSPASGTLAGWSAVAFTNGAGAPIESFSLNFDGEQWRNGGNTSAQTMVLEYGFGATFGTVSSWTAPGGAFNFTSPIVGSTSGALDGNAAANRVAGLGGTISNLSWNTGDTLWVRWIENNDAGNDHGLGIDNLSLSYSLVPEPGSIALAAFGAAGLLGLALRRRA